MFYIERGEIVADHRHHAVDCDRADIFEPLGLRAAGERVAIFLRQRRADAFQIVAWIEALGNFTYRLAHRLKVAQMRRAGEDVDLGAGIVDIIFARHRMADEFEQIGKSVAKDRAASMADMHGAGRVRRDIFDIDLEPDGAPHCGPAIV